MFITKVPDYSSWPPKLVPHNFILEPEYGPNDDDAGTSGTIPDYDKPRLLCFEVTENVTENGEVLSISLLPESILTPDTKSILDSTFYAAVIEDLLRTKPKPRLTDSFQIFSLMLAFHHQRLTTGAPPGPCMIPTCPEIHKYHDDLGNLFHSMTPSISRGVLATSFS